MFAKPIFISKTKLFRLSLIALMSLMATWMPVQTATVQAATPEYGYLWNLVFDFENSFDGVLTVEVGPWFDGDLMSVEETSVTTVRCTPVGTVKLGMGMASFYGDGYLECSMDIGEVVRNNHKLTPNNPDTYGSILMTTKASLGSDGSAPIFNHPDAQYRLDPVGPMVIDNITDISNNNGAMSATFSADWSQIQKYVSYYWCDPFTDCDLELSAGAATIALTGQGDPITFSTGPNTFTIGKDDTGYLTGRIDTLVVDPGNFVH